MLWIAVVCSVLLAGGINAEREVSLNAGEDYTFTVVAFPNTVASCHLITPQGKVLDFSPDQPQSGRYELQPISETMPSCMVTLKNVVESDSGIWEIGFKNANGQGSSQRFDVTIISGELEEHADVKRLNPIDFPTRVGENVDVTWPNPINFATRVGANVDISLSKTAFQEDCYVRKPGGSAVKTSVIDMDGVAVHSSSEFVSCRITIGPMDETLLGEWALCGIRIDSDNNHERCQLVRITWNRSDLPEAQWDVIVQPKYDHVVHFGGTLTPVVIGTGKVVSCHIITPNGEDLNIDKDTKYPHLNLVPVDRSTCSIAIGPIIGSLLGDWMLYGRFKDSVGGLHEIHLPMNLFLYDEENPYDQAYNVTILDEFQRAVNLGSSLNVEVTSTGQVDSCQFIPPSGEFYDLNNHLNYDGASFVGIGESVSCRLAIGPITKQMLGNWELTGKFINNGRFTELRQAFKVVQEDPANPIEEDRTVEYLTEHETSTEIGISHRIIISENVFITGESCHIRTPDGLQYTIMEGFSLPDVKIIEGSGIECGVEVHVLSEDAVGTWTLIARATRFSEPIERRLPYTIKVNEYVEAIPHAVTINEGLVLNVRLSNPTDQHGTCKLVKPNSAASLYLLDPLHVESCGFIMENVTMYDNGNWKIIYGNRITYTAEIKVTVNANSNHDSTTTETVEVIRERSMNQTVGPRNAVYCRLEDPQKTVVFEGFGRCVLSLDRVTLDHHGYWKMTVATEGKVVAETSHLLVLVKEPEGKPVVSTHVGQQKPIVTVSCSVPTNATVRACKFRDPQGKILLAASGVSEDRYTFHGTATTYQSEVRTHECGIQITNPLVSELGLWRCAIETDEDTHYGFMSVLCPWALQDPVVAASVQQVPILTATRALVSTVEDQSTTISCSVDAPIRYCYFRAANGTTFTVYPDMSSQGMEYVGAGFDAGECGVRFHQLTAADSGRWGCHVGLVGDTEEQSDHFQLTVSERMQVSHYTNHDSNIVVQGIVHDSRALEYCRFVRIDGYGFTTDSIISGYTFTGILDIGECQLSIRDPTILDMHPWTVVAKTRGQTEEISKDTMGSVMIGAPNPGPEDQDVVVIVKNQRGMLIFAYVFLSVLLASIILGTWLGPKRSREWTYARAGAIRTSFRNSFRKEPLPPNPQQQQQV